MWQLTACADHWLRGFVLLQGALCGCFVLTRYAVSHCGQRHWWPAFRLEHVPALRKKTLVEEHWGQVGEEQDGSKGTQRGNDPDWGVLHIHAVLHGASWEMHDWRQAQYGVSTQQPDHHSSHQAHDAAVTAGDVEVEDAHQLWEHQHAGDLIGQEPEEDDAALQVSQRCSDQTCCHHWSPDGPLVLSVRRLTTTHTHTKWQWQVYSKAVSTE